MILATHPRMQVRRLEIGRERTPLLVIDEVLADPERLVRKAAGCHYVAQRSMFPGVRAPTPLSYPEFLRGLLAPLLPEFGLAGGAFSFPMAHFSLVATAPGQLQFLQRVPHIDSVEPAGLATVHYLFHGDWGGTAFYRHRATGFERIDPARRDAYFECLACESRGGDAPGGGYIDGDTALFEQIERVDARFNRMLVYPRNQLHSGCIDDRRVPPADPARGRLSANTFVDVGRALSGRG